MQPFLQRFESQVLVKSVYCAFLIVSFLVSAAEAAPSYDSSISALHHPWAAVRRSSWDLLARAGPAALQSLIRSWQRDHQHYPHLYSPPVENVGYQTDIVPGLCLFIMEHNNAAGSRYQDAVDIVRAAMEAHLKGATCDGCALYSRPSLRGEVLAVSWPYAACDIIVDGIRIFLRPGKGRSDRQIPKLVICRQFGFLTMTETDLVWGYFLFESVNGRWKLIACLP